MILGLCVFRVVVPVGHGVAAPSPCGGRHDVAFATHDYASSQAPILAIACATEGVRELTPRQPIEVRVVDAASLRTEAGLIRQREVAAEKLDGTILAFQLLGALGPKQDLAAIRRSQYSGNTTAQYDSHDKILYVRADRPPYTPLDRALISHEYARALLDQNFNLDTLEGPHDSAAGHNSDAQLAAQALVEGDAYTTMLNFATTTFSRKDYLLLNQQLQSPANPPSDFPHDQITFPAAQGSTFVRYLMQTASAGKKGDAAHTAANMALDTAMHHPPTSTSEVLNPALYIQHPPTNTPPETVDPLDLGQNWTEVDSDVMGAFGISDLLSQHAKTAGDAAPANQAGAAWQSDRWVVYKDGANSLLVWKSRFTSTAGAQAFVRALSTYTGARFHTLLDNKAPLYWHTTGYAIAIRTHGTEVAVAMCSDDQSLDLLKQALALLGFS